MYRYDYEIDIDDDDDTFGPGYFAFWTTAPNEDVEDTEDVDPQFQQYFCTVCGNYETLPKNMQITLFHRSLCDRLFCACDDNEA